MVKRRLAQCHGQYIGIESLYTVNAGKQINKPERLKELRQYSRNNELFCPCGCGSNLILVAGDKNLREQHFREKAGNKRSQCTYMAESELSINSRIVLMSWLEDKLSAKDLKERVPIFNIEESAHRPEFTFLSVEKKFGVRYWRTRANIAEDKVETLHGNNAGIKVIYIVDCSNSGTEGQYQEYLMMLQNLQGYCLLLEIDGMDYSKAKIEAVIYEKDADECWQELPVVRGFLNRVEIVENELIVNRQSIESMVIETRRRFRQEQQVLKEQRMIEEERRKTESIRFWEKEKAIRERIDAERREQLKQAQEVEARRLEAEERNRRDEEDRVKQGKEEEWRLFRQKVGAELLQQKTQVIDPDGKPWAKCYFCSEIGLASDFVDIFGVYGKNRGKCNKCRSKFLKYSEKNRK